MYSAIHKKNVSKTQGFHSGHRAIDVVGGYKSKLYPVKSGICTVYGKGYNYKGRYWNSEYYEIRYNDGIRQRYFHNYKVYIRKGQRVNANTLVAREGNTGYVLTKDRNTGKWRSPTPAELARGVASHVHVITYDAQGRIIDGTNYLSQKPTMSNTNNSTTIDKNADNYTVQNLQNVSRPNTQNLSGRMYRSDVVQELIKVGIWSGRWQDNIDKFNSLNPTTPTNPPFWGKGSIVRVKNVIVTPTPKTDPKQEKINELQSKNEELEKLIEENKDKMNAEMNKLIEETKTQISEIESQLAEKTQELTEYQESSEQIIKPIDISHANIERITTTLTDINEKAGFTASLSGAWGRWVDNKFTSNVMRGWLKYNIPVLLGWALFTISGIGVAELFAQFNVTLPSSIILALSTFVSFTAKDLIRYDKNNDGKLDANDLINPNEDFE